MKQLLSDTTNGLTLSFWAPAEGDADAEIKVPGIENPELLKVLFLKPGTDPKVAMHASLTVKKSAFLIFAFRVHSVSLFPNPFEELMFCPKTIFAAYRA